MEKKRYSLSIGFVTEGLPFDGSTLEKKSLGGSETMMAQMARELSKLGHDVKVFCNCPKPGIYGDRLEYIHIQNLQNLATTFEFDVLIVSRFFQYLPLKFKTAYKVLWNHDVPVSKPEDFIPNLYNTDSIFCLSDYHVDLYSKAYPDVAHIINKTRNGIDFDIIEKVRKEVKEKDPNKIIYISRPERGLDVLSQLIFPKLKYLRPNLKLYICGYSLGNFPIAEDTRNFYAHMDNVLSNTEGIINLGHLTKYELYKHIAESVTLVYPTAFPEISCLTAMESQALGTPMITTDAFALSETIQIKDYLVQGNNATQEYQDKFCARVIEYLRPDKKHYRDQTKEAYELVKAKYDIKVVAKEWEDFFLTQLYDRFINNLDKVVDNMGYHSDWHSASLIPDLSVSKKKDIDDVIENALNGKEEYDSHTKEQWEMISNSPENWKGSSVGMGRFPHILDIIDSRFKRPVKILDLGCHYGEFGIWTTFYSGYNHQVTGIDFSEKCIEKANYLKEHIAQKPELLEFKVCKIEDFPVEDPSKYDVVLAGEVIEHIKDTKEFVNHIEKFVNPGGLVIYTIPNGPWESMMWNYAKKETKKFHIHNFKFSDIKDIFGKKENFEMRFNPWTLTNRGDLVGHWILAYSRNDERETGEVNQYRKWMSYRPYQTLTACVIAGSEEENILQCLKSINRVVDETVVLYSGKDLTKTLAEHAGAKVIPYKWENDFAAARNKSKENVTSDWILWIDCDEKLVEGHEIRKYLDSSIFNAYVVRQCHLILDVPNTVPDVPNRLFRNKPHYQFVGVVHEHPEDLNKGPADNPIIPTCIIPDAAIAHYGYTTEKERRVKCGFRNLKPLLLDLKKNPERKLSWTLLMRDYINLTNWALETNRHEFLGPEEQQYLLATLDIYNEKFSDERALYHNLAWPFYQTALQHMSHFKIKTKSGDIPFKVAITLGGAVGNFDEGAENTKPKLLWFESKDSFKKFMKDKTDALVSKVTEVR
ncbi:methyltransferase domain-containing protein [Candidatus Pacearchaeota archaeon]|nr:methyltransferase domain-containing protein [Candidatus Pacearchaeota archaeon]